MIGRAILNLMPGQGFNINGEVNNETDYNNIQWVIGVDETNTAIYGTVAGVPTWPEIQSEVARLEEEARANEYLQNRETAMHELLPESMYMPAMLEQAKADREAGKTLEPGLEEAVNIYMQILVDNPEPN